jgi:hypothetical protein
MLLGEGTIILFEKDKDLTYKKIIIIPPKKINKIE